MVDLKLLYESKLEKREAEIASLLDERERLRDQVKGKDDAIMALSHTLIEKGEHNKKLSLKLSELKNH